MEISLAAETLFNLGPIHVTNSLLSAFIVAGVIALLAIAIGSRLSVEKPGRMQLFMEMMIDGFNGMAKKILGHAYSTKMFSFLFTFFFFIILSNWFGLLPFVGPIVIEHPHEVEEEVSAPEEREKHEEKITLNGCIKDRDCVLTADGIKKMEAFPVFRAPTSDVSGTLALALISVAVTNVLGFYTLKFAYLSKYISFKDPISFFVGILELVSEIGKIISFTFRLFGNVFAGEVLLLVMTSISFGLATLPFMLLEVFVGFIQAFVFFMLTMVFTSLAITSHSKH